MMDDYVEVFVAFLAAFFIVAGTIAELYLYMVYRDDPRPHRSWLLRMLWRTGLMILVATYWLGGLTIFRLAFSLDLPAWTRWVSTFAIILMISTILYKADTVRRVRKRKSPLPPFDGTD